jgi:asparagine synthase (glutamine-hydrolysing)
MAHKMIHRGPDDDGYLLDGQFGFGMRRLSIIDLNTGHQPISNERRDVHLVLNGEIFNYKDLRSQLTSRGHHFSTQSDAEVIVHLYEEFGRDCIHQLNGMFAFALYDSRINMLWVARDRLGIKPLFYYLSNEFLHFSSDLNALNSILRGRLNPNALIAYMGYSYVPGTISIFDEIKKLPAGNEILIEDNSANIRRYWTLPSPVYNRSVELLSEELDALLGDAVRLQLQSDVPVGILLSGGIDSSAVAAYSAAHLSGSSLYSYTVDFEGKRASDARYSDQLSRQLCMQHNNISIHSKDYEKLLEDLILALDEPISDNAIVSTFAIASLASSQGIKVLLSGGGADEIFGGYHRHLPPKPGSSSWIAQLPPTVRRLLRPIFHLWKPSLTARLENPARNYFLSTSGSDLHLLQHLLNNRSLFDELLASFDSHLACLNPQNSYSLMQVDLHNYLPDNVLSLTDKATMAASVEGRFPLLDHRLVEFAFRLPPCVNLLNGRSKGLFRHVLASRLPRSILSRPKEGFNAPTSRWFPQWAPMFIKELVENPSPLLEDLFDLRKLRPLLESPNRHLNSAETLYSLFILNRWLLRHVNYL